MWTPDYSDVDSPVKRRIAAIDTTTVSGYTHASLKGEETIGGKHMRIGRLLFAGLALVALTSSVQAGVRLGIGIGIGIPCFPCYRPYYYGYPYPYYVAPAPVVVAALPPWWQRPHR